MDTIVLENFENNADVSVDSKTEWVAPEIGKLDIKRTLLSASGADDGAGQSN